jgi:hypothetical protein
MASPYSSDTSSAFSADQDERTRKLNRFANGGATPSLAGLSNFANDEESSGDLQKEPLYGGNLSKTLSTADSASAEPSALATERVQRAPSMEEASPLLNPAERVGNLLTGEEGRYGPLTQGERGVSLKDFFGNIPRPSVGQDTSVFAPEGPEPGIENVQKAKQAYGYADKADQATGGNVRSSLQDLYHYLFPGERGETGGVSLSDAVRSGAGAGGSAAGYGAFQIPAGVLNGTSGGSLAAEGANYTPFILNAADYGAAAGGSAAGAGAGASTGAAEGSTAASTAGAAGGTALGAASVASAAYSLMKLAYQLGLGGEGPSSGNQWMDLAMGFLGPVGDAVGAFARPAFTPSHDWMDFGGEVGRTLNHEGTQLQNLVYALQHAKTQGDVTQAADLFRTAIDSGGSGVGGYQLADPFNGAPQIGALPGATGKRHEWGIEADFGAPVEATNAALRELFAALPAGVATPLGQASFNARMTDPEYTQYGTEYNNAMNAAGPSNDWNSTQGRTPQAALDLISASTLSPRLQDLMRTAVQQSLAERYWNAWYNSPEYYASLPSTGGGDGGGPGAP